jgi:tetratricopeptide (TPR) repeat protein
METFNFDFFSSLDDSVGRAQAEFARGEYAQALLTIAAMPASFHARADVLELQAKCHEPLARYAEAAAAWQQLVRIDPGHRTAQAQLAWCNSKIGTEELFGAPQELFDRSRFAEALASLDAGPPGWRNHPEFHRLRAVSQERLGDYMAALESWQDMLAIAPSDPLPHVQIPVCEALLGHAAAAAAGFEAAAERFPDNMAAQFNWLFHRVSHGRVADAIGVVLAEVRRLCDRTGNSQPFKSQLDTFKTRLLALFDPLELAARDTEGVLQLATSARAVGDSLRSIYEQFEPVGNNCEFGFAQRKHGAEPLALFRWTAVTPQNLVRLLRDRLEGYDAPERYRLEENREREFILKEDVYETASHTYVKAPGADAAALLQKLARRQAFLHRKFMETLAEGRKVFIYKYDQRLDASQMDAIERGLRELGARKFLFVMRAGEGDAAGTARCERPGRAVGFVSDVMPNTQFLEWDQIVKQAYRLLA